jgi:hypothetical protein
MGISVELAKLSVRAGAVYEDYASGLLNPSSDEKYAEFIAHADEKYAEFIAHALVVGQRFLAELRYPHVAGDRAPLWHEVIKNARGDIKEVAKTFAKQDAERRARARAFKAAEAKSAAANKSKGRRAPT